MSIDLRTLVFILGVTYVIQVIVFFYQYVINKVYRGIGWWLLWSVAESAGFAFILLRQVPEHRVLAILGQNSMIVLGVIFFYIGVLRFLERAVPPAILPGYIAFIAALTFFLLVRDDAQVRGVLVSVALAGLAFLSARAFFVHRPRGVSASANFIAAVLLAHGVYFAYRAAALTAGVPSDDIFAPTMFNVVMFMDALIASILWTFGIILMISQRLSAEANEAKEHFELIFDTSPDAAAITRLADGVIVDINHGFTLLSGLSREEAIGRSVVDASIWKDPAASGKIITALREKGSCEDLEAEFLRKDGRPFLGSISARVIFLHGAPHVISVIRDISERRRTEEALKERNTFVESVLENAPIGFAVNRIDDGQRVFVSRSFERIYGVPENSLNSVADYFEKVYLDPEFRERIRDRIMTDMASGDASRMRWEDIPITTLTGERKVVTAINIPLFAQNLMISTVQDVTERKRAEDRIKALLREKEILLKEVHHRIKNNMSSMMSLLSLQSNALKNPEAAAALREARDRLRSMGMLYDRLYRSENLREMSLKDYLPSLVDDIVGVFPNKDRVKIEKRVDDIVLGVKVLSPLGIIVNELVTNAMKHAFSGREGGVLSVAASMRDGRVTLVIEDDGAGLPESFDPARLTGFGLQLVDMLTAQIDGTLRIERRNGTRFVLEFDA